MLRKKREIPKNAYRIFTDPKGVKQLHFIDGQGSVIPLIPEDRHKRMDDGYYTRRFKLIRRSFKGLTA